MWWKNISFCGDVVKNMTLCRDVVIFYHNKYTCGDKR